MELKVKGQGSRLCPSEHHGESVYTERSDDLRPVISSTVSVGLGYERNREEAGSGQVVHKLCT